MKEISCQLSFWGYCSEEEMHSFFAALAWKDHSLVLENSEEQDEEGEIIWQVNLKGRGMVEEQQVEELVQQCPYGTLQLCNFQSYQPTSQTLSVGSQTLKKQDTKKILHSHLPGWMSPLMEKDQKELSRLANFDSSLLTRSVALHALLQKLQPKQQQNIQQSIWALQNEQESLRTRIKEHKEGVPLSSVFQSSIDFLLFFVPNEYGEKMRQALVRYHLLRLKKTLRPVKDTTEFFPHFDNVYKDLGDLHRLLHACYRSCGTFYSPEEQWSIRKKSIDKICAIIDQEIKNLGQEQLWQNNDFFSTALDDIFRNHPSLKQRYLALDSLEAKEDAYIFILQHRLQQTEENISRQQALLDKQTSLAQRDLLVQKQNPIQIQKEIELRPGSRHVVFVRGLTKDSLVYVSKTAQPEITEKLVYSFSIDWQQTKSKLLYEKELLALQKAWENIQDADMNKYDDIWGFPVLKHRGISYLCMDNLESLDFSHLSDAEFWNIIQDNIPSGIGYSKMPAEIFLQKPGGDAMLKAYRQLIWRVMQEESTLKRETEIKPSKNWKNRLEAEILPDQEFDVISLLQQHGAKLVNHNMNLPSYSSWAKVEDGYALQLEKDGAKITYVPRYAQGIFPTKETFWQIDVAKHKDFLIDQLIKDSPHLPQYDEENITVLLQGNSVYTFSSLNRLNELLQTNFTQTYLDEKKGKKEPLEFSQIEDGPLEDKYIPWSLSEFLKVKGELDAVGNVVKLPNGKWITKNSVLHSSIQALKEESVITLEDNCILEDREKEHYRLKELLKGHGYLATSKEITDLFQKQNITQKEVYYQTAPLSEQGRFFVEGLDVSSALNLLKNMDIIKEVEDSVPWGVLSGNKSCVYSQETESYTQGLSAGLPAEYGIIHGMTANRDTKAEKEIAVKNLKNILLSGGLFSIKTRRQMGSVVSSMSPLGDIASGIDHGIPTNLARGNVYGKGIFFLMKPECLTREKVWFAPKDFGGGEDRYQKYADYAASLGERNHFQAPSKQARELHLQSLKNRELSADNEVYFEDGIPLSDIDTIFVEPDLFLEVKQMIAELDPALPLPRIDSWMGGEDAFQKAFRKRCRKINLG